MTQTQTSPMPPEWSSLCSDITRHAPLPIAMVEGVTHIVRFANPAFCNLLKKPVEQVLGKAIHELLPEKDVCVSLLNRVFKTGEPESHIEREQLGNRALFWAYTTWPVHEDNRLVGVMIQVAESAELHNQTVAMNEALMVGAVRQHELTEAAENFNKQLQEEISARKGTERELAEKARLLDLTNDAIIVRDSEDNISLWNKGAERLYGWTCEEVLGRNMHKLLQTEFPKPMVEIISQLYQDGSFTGEVVQIARDGRRVTSLCRWVLDRDTESILTSYTDITERKQTEQSLIDFQKRYRHLFNLIDEGFCIIEMIFDESNHPIDYRFLEVNPSFEKQCGLHSAVGKTMRELVPRHETFWFETYGAVALTGKPIRVLRRAEALDRWFDAYASPFGNEESRKVAILFRDVTAQKRNQMALQVAQEELSQHAANLEEVVRKRTALLQDSVQSLESLTYTMAHDLRAPIRAMKAFTNALLEDVPLNETGKDYASRINNAAQRMDQLVNDLLDYGQLSHLNFDIEPIDLNAVISKALVYLDHAIQQAHAEVEVSQPFPVVMGNNILLNQAISNLVLNALKFVGPGVNPKVHIRSETRGDVARLWVEDQGIGIALRHQPKIFGVFQRLHTTEVYPGTGVGLAIVKRAVERMGGTVGVESELGKGSQFWIDLPVAMQNE